MQTTYFWHKLHLHRTKIIVLFFLFLSVNLMGQSIRPGITMHRVDSDKKNIKYGFLLGVHQNWYGVKYSDRFLDTEYDEVSSISGISRVGFDLGFMVNLQLDDQFWVRVVPVKVGLYQNIVRYYHTLHGSQRIYILMECYPSDLVNVAFITDLVSACYCFVASSLSNICYVPPPSLHHLCMLTH